MNFEKVKEEAYMQSLVIFLSTFTGLFLGFIVQVSYSSIENANFLHITKENYNLSLTWLDNYILFTYDLASQLIFSVIFGFIFMGISIIILWQKRRLIFQMSKKHPSLILLCLFLLSWIFQPLHSMITTWGSPNMGIIQVDIASASVSEKINIQSAIESLKSFRFFGIEFLKSLLHTGFIFSLWFCSSIIYNINEYDDIDIIKKRGIKFLLISSLSFLVYVFVYYLITQIPVPSRFTLEVVVTLGIQYVTGESQVLRFPGYDILSEIEPILYDLLFFLIPICLWIFSLIRNIIRPLTLKLNT